MGSARLCVCLGGISQLSISRSSLLLFKASDGEAATGISCVNQSDPILNFNASIACDY